MTPRELRHLSPVEITELLMKVTRSVQKYLVVATRRAIPSSPGMGRELVELELELRLEVIRRLGPSTPAQRAPFQEPEKLELPA